MKRKLKHSKGALKQEKIDLITTDIAKNIIEGSLDDSDCDDDVDDDIDDGVLDEIGEDDSDDDISENSDEDQEEDESVQQENNVENLLQTTPYGRTCRTWRSRARAADVSWIETAFADPLFNTHNLFTLEVDYKTGIQ